jgi:hypothetical protein
VGALGAFLPPYFKLPHVVIEPSALRAAKKDAPNAPTDKGYTKVYSTTNAFAALKIDGSIKGWGRAYSGGANSPDDKGYTEIYSSASAPPEYGLPHALIEPLRVRAAKALVVE